MTNILSDDYDEGAISHQLRKCSPGEIGVKQHYRDKCFTPERCRGEKQFSERFCRHPRNVEVEPIEGVDFVYRDYSNMVRTQRAPSIFFFKKSW